MKKQNNKRAIVTLSIGTPESWYHKGRLALLESLNKVGENATTFFANYEKPERRSVYEDKIAHIKHAGYYYKQILWLDCSITAIGSLEKVWRYIEKNGVYLYQSGASCAETCNDNCLKTYGITRDQAALIPECASNVVGINLEHETGKKFFDLWIGSLENDSNIGEKWPSVTQKLGESLDARFKYHRQDQSTASLSAWKAGVKLEREGHFVVRHENFSTTKSKDTCLVLKGGVGE